jgi:hypothetical protein
MARRLLPDGVRRLLFPKCQTPGRLRAHARGWLLVPGIHCRTLATLAGVLGNYDFQPVS